MAARGIASRRKCEEMIAAGKVRVNGEIITQLGYKIDPTAEIVVDGKSIVADNAVYTYILLNKPLKVITSVSDPQRRTTVIDLITTTDQRIYPVGRLDYDTEGLILLTNDGELANRMTHPRFEFEKEYIATVKGTPDENKLEQLRQGILLEDGITSPAEVAIIGSKQNGNTKLCIVIHEGKNRQVRRMCKAIGYPVIHLQRRRLGFLTIGNLSAGEYRHLTADEIHRLKKVLKMT